MFDFIRKHTKITMGLLFLLIVPSFVLLGLNDYGQREGTAVVATVAAVTAAKSTKVRPSG